VPLTGIVDMLSSDGLVLLMQGLAAGLNGKKPEGKKAAQACCAALHEAWGGPTPYREMVEAVAVRCAALTSSLVEDLKAAGDAERSTAKNGQGKTTPNRGGPASVAEILRVRRNPAAALFSVVSNPVSFSNSSQARKGHQRESGTLVDADARRGESEVSARAKSGGGGCSRGLTDAEAALSYHDDPAAWARHRRRAIESASSDSASGGAAEEAAAKAAALGFVASLPLLPFSVLGQQLSMDGKVRSGVGPDALDSSGTVIVDPAGLHHIQPPGGPKGAGGAARAIYTWTGIESEDRFPEPVVDAVKVTGDAKYVKARSLTRTAKTTWACLVTLVGCAVC